ncbi:hypothetical protein [Ulvibacterium sp.]|uniref:hypothetical protein n=1 Tax=Ulvibacterium sp. TaxID=2665914 RepID=UPI00261D960F|nr:hypothetical protein [Ulvibacterium sp.]
MTSKDLFSKNIWVVPLLFFLSNCSIVLGQCLSPFNFSSDADGSFESLSGVASNDAFSLSNVITGAGWSPVIGFSGTWVSPMPLTGSNFFTGIADGMPSSPDGGVFVGGYVTTSNLGVSFRTTITGLDIGQIYVLKFYQANAGIDGNTPIDPAQRARWSVTFGTQTFTSTAMGYLGEGNQIWMEEEMTFIATATSQNLTFTVDNDATGFNYEYMALDGVRLFIDNDTDGDGIRDCNDLDDDNDGITDLNEGHTCPGITLGEVYVNTALGEIATYDLETNAVNVLCSGLQISGDIGIAPDGQIYTIELGGASPTDSEIRRVGTSSCSETVIGTVPVGGAVAMSFLPDGSALVGFYTTPMIYRVTLSPFTVTPWASVPGFIPLGDFSLVNGQLYYLAHPGNPAINYSIEIDIDPVTYDYVSHSTPTLISGGGYGASVSGTCQVVYGGLDTIILLDDITTGSSGRTITTSIPEIGPIFGLASIYEADGCNNACTEIDTDNDGIADHLDTDSDADTCPDAVEGGAVFTKNDLDANNRLAGAVDTDPSSPNNGIPLAAGSGQTVGSAQDNTLRLGCPTRIITNRRVTYRVKRD